MYVARRAKRKITNKYITCAEKSGSLLFETLAMGSWSGWRGEFSRVSRSPALAAEDCTTVLRDLKFKMQRPLLLPVFFFKELVEYIIIWNIKGRG